MSASLQTGSDLRDRLVPDFKAGLEKRAVPAGRYGAVQRGERTERLACGGGDFDRRDGAFLIATIARLARRVHFFGVIHRFSVTRDKFGADEIVCRSTMARPWRTPREIGDWRCASTAASSWRHREDKGSRGRTVR